MIAISNDCIFRKTEFTVYLDPFTVLLGISLLSILSIPWYWRCFHSPVKFTLSIFPLILN